LFLIFFYCLFKFGDYFFQRLFIFPAGSIKMAATVKIFPGKSVYIKPALTSERAFSLVSPIYNYRSQPNAFYTQRKIYEAFGVAGFYINLIRSFWGMAMSAVLYS
jgi:hypothetical protein